MESPIAKKLETIVDMHGIQLVDSYNWLREKESPEVMEYLKNEVAYTDHIMQDTVDLQNSLFEEIKNRIKEDDSSVPTREDDYYYYSRTEKGKNYAIHCRKYQSIDASEKIILDENLLASNTNYFHLRGLETSPDHTLLAYSTDTSGYETYTIYIKDLTSGEIIDTIENTGGQLTWGKDSTTLFYNILDDVHRSSGLAKHILHEKEDELLMTEDDKQYSMYFSKTRDRQYLFVLNHMTETDEWHYARLDDPQMKFTQFNKREPGIELSLTHHEGYFYILTNRNAVNFKLLRTKVDAPEKANWQELIPHNPAIFLANVTAFKDFLIITKRQNGYAEIMFYEFATNEYHDIQLPEEIHALGFNDNPMFETDFYRFNFSSPVTPTTVFDYNIKSRSLTAQKVDEIKNYDSSLFVTERLYATAADGVQIPLSVSYKKGTKLNGTANLLLYGYGSYGYSIDPYFSSSRISLLERGMIFVIAHIRGGGEFGKPWYHQGKMFNKMNTFTDFISAAEYLIAQKYTTSEHLAIMGGSAGGLLMGAVTNLRPDLFHTVLALVPFVDVINTMSDASIPLTTFEYTEWGNPAYKKEFEYMMQYSPYDNVEAKEYPDMLISGGLNDPRVHYWEPAKFTAKLRALKTDSNLLILKMNLEAGHSGVSGRYDSMKETAFYYAFLMKSLGMPYK